MPVLGVLSHTATGKVTLFMIHSIVRKQPKALSSVLLKQVSKKLGNSLASGMGKLRQIAKQTAEKVTAS